MESKLHFNIIRPTLLDILKTVMAAREFDAFRLVGGTALSLYKGHRESIDIDLFSDALYDSIDFKAIDIFLRRTYPYIDTIESQVTGPGKSYFAGNGKDDCVKLDLFYTDRFIHDAVYADDIRLAHIEDIIAMKADVVSRGGRKKDFWDIHELMEDYPVEEMIALHRKRYPYNHDKTEIRKRFCDFTMAEDDFDPVCLKGKHWEIIKLDITDFAGCPVFTARGMRHEA